MMQFLVMTTCPGCFQTALREAEEETAICVADVDVWSRLPALMTRDGANRVTPIVGVVDQAALTRLTICTDEVQAVFIVSL